MAALACEKCGSVDRNKWGRCRQCARKASERWRKKHPELFLAGRAAHRQRNPEESAARAKRQKLKRFDLTLEEYGAMFAAQNGVCKICSKPEEGIDSRTGKVKALAVDHDHATGRVRGLLCGKCNHLLGLVKDDKEVLASAYDYLDYAEHPALLVGAA